MKKAFLLLFLLASSIVISFPACAQNGSAITMNAKNKALASVLQLLEDKSNYKILYDKSDVEKYTVTLDVANATVFSVLDQALSKTELKYTVDGNIINIERNKQSVVTHNSTTGVEEQSVKGYVFDKDTGEPVVGALIKVVGTKIAAVTNPEGLFRLNAFNLAQV